MKKRILTTSLTSAIASIGVVFVIISCSPKNRSEGDSFKKIPVEIDTAVELQDSLLQGVWWSSPDDIHATFNIVDDSLYYTEEQESPYFVKLENSSLIMSRDGVRFVFDVRKLTTDSLVLYDKNMHEVVRFYKGVIP